MLAKPAFVVTRIKKNGIIKAQVPNRFKYLLAYLSREAQLLVGWVSALRNPCGRWVSCFNPTYVDLIFNSTHLC